MYRNNGSFDDTMIPAPRELKSDQLYEKWIIDAPELCRNCSDCKVAMRDRPEVKENIVYYCDKFPEGVQPDECEYRYLSIQAYRIESVIENLTQLEKNSPVKIFGLDIYLETAIKNLNEMLEASA